MRWLIVGVGENQQYLHVLRSNQSRPDLEGSPRVRGSQAPQIQISNRKRLQSLIKREDLHAAGSLKEGSRLCPDLMLSLPIWKETSALQKRKRSQDQKTERVEEEELPKLHQ